MALKITAVRKRKCISQKEKDKDKDKKKTKTKTERKTKAKKKFEAGKCKSPLI